MDKNNIYLRARREAAARNPLFSSRERVAEMVYCCAYTLGDYENGNIVPPCHVVQQMIEVYGTPWLRAAHIRANCPILTEQYRESDGESTLEHSALGWALTFPGVHDIALQFAAVARDGKVGPGEEKLCAKIRAKAVEIRAMMQESIDALDEAMGQGARKL